MVGYLLEVHITFQTDGHLLLYMAGCGISTLTKTGETESKKAGEMHKKDEKVSCWHTKKQHLNRNTKLKKTR